MARLVPKNGAVSFGSYVADFNSFGLEAAQAVEGVTPYGANTCSVNVGSGTPDFRVSIGAAALGHVSGSNPQLPGGSGMFLNVGLATTLTLDTGVSWGFNMVTSRFAIGHGRMRAAVPVSISGANGNDVVETWATS